jgi:aryl carrier-like protein
MEPMVEPFRRCLAEVRFSPPKIPYISSLTGTWIQDHEAVSPDYYVRQLTGTVRFGDGLSELFKMEGAVFLEASPGRGLSLYIDKHMDKPPEVESICLVRHREEAVPDDCYTLQRLNRFWCGGWNIDWRVLYGEQPPQRIPLPAYPFQKHRYWLEMSPSENGNGNRPEVSVHISAAESRSDGDSTTRSRPPEGELEIQLAALWRDIFGMAEPGADDDFFQLGGDSLKALTLAGNIRRAMGTAVKVADVFQNPTISALASFLGRRQTTAVFRHLAIVEKRDYYQTSPAQRRIYLAQLAAPGTSSYNVTSVVRIQGAFDKSRVDPVVARLVRRHEGLRTSFRLKGENIVQRVAQDVDIMAHRLNPASTLSAADETVMSFVRPFDMGKAPLMRVGLMDIPDNSCLLVLDTHHIITDEASLAVFVREFIQLYNGKRLTPLQLQYRDYAVWQESFRGSAEFARQESFWRDELAEPFPPLRLPFDTGNQRERMMKGDSVLFEISPTTLRQLTHLAAQEGATLFMVLLAAFFVFLSKICGQSECTVGTAVQGRRHQDLESIVGVFINMLVLRVEIEKDWTFAHCVKEVKAGVLAAMDNQDYPFEALSLTLDATFGLQNLKVDSLGGGDFSVRQHYHSSTTAKYPLTLLMMEGEDGLSGDLEYATSLFSAAAIRELISVFRKIVERVALEPSVRIEELDIVPPEKKRELESEIARNRDIDDVGFNL